jgi:hypothetical protein
MREVFFYVCFLSQETTHPPFPKDEPNQNKTKQTKPISQFRIHVPFVLATSIWKLGMNIPEEPLLSLELQLTPEGNEAQELFVLIHKLITQPAPSTRLSEIISGYPDLANVAVKIPEEPSWTQLNHWLRSPNELLPLWNEYRKARICAFVNALHAPFGDAFIILELSKSQVINSAKYTHAIIMLQSKGKETAKKRQETDKDLFSDFQKTIYKHTDMYTKCGLLPIYVYVTDAHRVSPGRKDSTSKGNANRVLSK